MKHITTILKMATMIAPALFSPVWAQINLDESDLPEAGLNLEIEVVDLVPQSFDLKLESDTFHLDLNALSVSGADTVSFVSPSEVPQAHLFPGSELVTIHAHEGQRTHNYLKKHDGDLKITGLYLDVYGDGILRDVHLDPYGTLMRTPLSLSDSFIDYHAFVDTATNVPSFPGVDTMILQSLILEQVVVDGHGTISIPDFGSFEVLRVKHQVERFDSARAYSIAQNQWVSFDNHEKSLGYLYYAKAQGVPLMQVQLSSSGYPQQITFIKEPKLIQPPAGIASAMEVATFEVYPNPGDGHVSLRFPQATSIHEYALYDLGGRMIEQAHLNEHVSMAQHQIKLTALAGLYHLQVITEAGAHTSLIQISP